MADFTTESTKKSRFLEVKDAERERSESDRQLETKDLEATPDRPRSSQRLETVAEEARVLATKQTDDYKLTLKVQKGDLELTATIKPNHKGPILKVPVIMALLKEHAIQGNIHREAIQHFCEKACRNISQEQVVIVSGIPPVKGKDETLQFLAQPSSKIPQFEKDGKGNVDYTNGHFFQNVFPGQKIATRLPAQPGKEGRSLFGEVLPAQPGLPLESPPECGENVSSHGNDYFAQVEGRIVYEKNALAITDQLVIHGDLNHNIGNIDFAGFVTVKSNVENGFVVKAKKGILIHGNVGNAHLSSDGNIEIKGGMSGNEIGFIHCGGNLTARYLDDITIECENNITITKEIINSHVKCGGALTMPSGSIIGGNYLAFKGVEAYDIGAETGANTRIEVGMHYRVQEQAAELRKEFKESIKKTTKMNGTLDYYMKHPDELDKLTPERQGELKVLTDELKQEEKHKKTVKDELDNLRNNIHGNANPMVIIHHALYNQVTFSFKPDHAEENKVTIRKPLTILENSCNGKLRFTTIHRLTEKAQDIEKMIRHREHVEEQKRKSQREKLAAR